VESCTHQKRAQGRSWEREERQSDVESTASEGKENTAVIERERMGEDKRENTKQKGDGLRKKTLKRRNHCSRKKGFVAARGRGERNPRGGGVRGETGNGGKRTGVVIAAALRLAGQKKKQNEKDENQMIKNRS